MIGCQCFYCSSAGKMCSERVKEIPIIMFLCDPEAEFLPRFFSPFCHRWSFGSLPLSPLACLVGDTSFSAISQT